MVLILVLAAALSAQFLLARGTDLPDPSVLAPRRLRPLNPAMIPDYPAVLRAPVFAPDRAPGEAPSASSTAAATGPQVLGVAALGGAGRAIVRGLDGASHVLAPGETLDGWKLVGLSASGAAFVGPTGSIRVPIAAAGAKPPQAAAGGQTTASEPPL